MNSCAQIVDSMGYAGCDLTCQIDSIHGEFEVSGTVCVQEKAEGGIIFSGKLAGLLADTTGGFHIHSGNACEPGTSQGGHYYLGAPWPTPDTTPWCPISDDPWVSDAPYFSFWASNYDGTAEPVIHMGDDVTQGGAFNVGDDNADCGVKGHAVIVHKGCPAENPECTNGGDRIGCCVLA